jgi:hypothetical protein
MEGQAIGAVRPTVKRGPRRYPAVWERLLASGGARFYSAPP